MSCSSLYFFISLFLSLLGFSHWISEYPGPLHHGHPGWGPGSWPRPVDLQHGGCGHWEGRCFAPTHSAAFSTLPCECLPPFPKTPMCPSPTPVTTESSWPIISCPHFDPVSPESQPTEDGSRQIRCLFFLFTFPGPQLSKDAALASQSSGPLFPGHNGFSLGERPFKVFTVTFLS